MEIVYICSPYKGENRLEREQNILNAKKYGKFALDSGYVPIITHLSIAELLDDSNEEERLLGIQADKTLLKVCSEIWVFGNKTTNDMKEEIYKAVDLGIRIRCFNEDCHEYTSVIVQQKLHSLYWFGDKCNLKGETK